MEKFVERDILFKNFFEKIQLAISRTVVLKSTLDLSKIKNVVAVDSAYKNDELMVTGAIVWSLEKREVLWRSYIECKPTYPYTPGLLYLREGPAILKILEDINLEWDLLLVDGHGVLHPRRAGLATVVGFILDVPTIGVAKRLLVGEEAGGEGFGYVLVDGEVLGYWFRDGGKFYVSPGYGLSIEDVLNFMRFMENRYPEPLKIVDRYVRSIMQCHRS
ncbi:MAG: endonuclease V [Nitrososphaerota archaeon]|nr:endonuclease V [Candidatus Geocrenenecus dongiae]